MQLRCILALGVLGLAFALPAAAKPTDVADPDAPRSLPDQGPVSVRWQDPAQFSELRGSGNRNEARRGNWVVQLATHLRKRAEKRLRAGERLDVEILDIRRAGNYEPWRGFEFDRTRFIREIYPPRIELSFTHIDANGTVVAKGERKLSDSAFMGSGGTVGNSDPLRYEKSLIDRWLLRELRASG